jgi:O-acetyl-ADP-ribose deacetylase (regulator of RNase III)
MIYWKKGNLLESDCDYICQQVNCQGKMNSGIARQIREKWPVVYQNYMTKCSQSKYIRPELLLGDIQIVGLWENFYETDFH